MKKILVIDDAEYILESTSILLGFEGFDVVTANNGLEGTRKAIEVVPDLIICDISMPEMDGYQVLDYVRNNALTKTIPFIFLTAFTEKSKMRAGMERGADDYLFKPFTRDELIFAIEAQIKKTLVKEEQLQEKVDEISKSITNALPHEFRTVINQIIGSAKFIKQINDDFSKEELMELSDDIIQSAERLNKITENYLIYSKIESFILNPIKRKQLKSSHTDEPAIIIQEIIQLVADAHLRAADYIFDGDIYDISIAISSESVHKLFYELIDNAFRFSNVGKIIKVSLSKSELFFVVEILDSGRGMSKEQITRIGAYVQFERDVYEQQGVGLGLSIAKKLVELHDGTFEISSELGIGTCIKISLPLVN